MGIRGMSVEFVGLPGSGKSTFSRRVTEIIARHGAPVDAPADRLVHELGAFERRIRKCFRVLGEIVLHPRYAARSAKAIFDTRQGSATDLVQTLFNWLFVSALVRHSNRRSGIHVFDEGVFQALWSIGFSTPHRAITDVARKLEGLFPAPSLVVVLETSIGTVEHRLQDRQGADSRLEQRILQDPDLLRRSVSLFDELKTVLRTFFEQRGRIRLLVARNELAGELEANARGIAESIESAFRGSSSHESDTGAGLRFARRTRASKRS